jgi:hypothetical protein
MSSASANKPGLLKALRALPVIANLGRRKYASAVNISHPEVSTRVLKKTMIIKITHLGIAVSFALCLLMLGTISDRAWASSPFGDEISLVNISQTTASFATAVPQVAVSRVDPNLVAVAWRKYGLPINTNAGAALGERRTATSPSRRMEARLSTIRI